MDGGDTWDYAYVASEGRKKGEPKKEAQTFRVPSDRHFPGSLSIPKKAGNSLFTIPRSEVQKDVEEINGGKAVKSGSQFTTASGRIYGFHDDILFPISGPGIVQLSSQQYNLLVLFQDDPQKGAQSLQKLLEKGIMSPADAEVVKKLAGV